MKIAEDVRKIIEENVIAFATVDKNFQPRAIAVGDVKVISDDEILVGDIHMKKSLNNLKNNKQVSLVVWDEEFNGFTLNGVVEYFTEGEWFEKACKIHAGYSVKGAIIVKILEISALK